MAKLAVLTALTMVAFAANSVLTRVALGAFDTDAMTFGLVRIAAGAVMLAAIVSRQADATLSPGRRNVAPSLALSVYVVGFSVAYLRLDTGIGALILFGGVQVTMFIIAVLTGQNITKRKWIGAALAMAGVTWLLLPGAAAPDLGASLWMGAAAIGWGIYTVLGQGATDPMGDTQKAFLLSLPLMVLVWFASSTDPRFTATGLGLAVVSGAVTSALGYALWYQILPRLQTTTAAIAQLTVPSLAMAGGIVFLAEDLTVRFIAASAVVILGVVIATGRAAR